MSKRVHCVCGKKFYSHIPTLLAEVDKASLRSHRVMSLLQELEPRLAKLDKQVAATPELLDEMMTREAEASWQMAEGSGNRHLFAFLPAMADPRRDAEVQDIIRAMRFGSEMLAELPLCSRLMQDIHYLVCHSDRYEKRYPGEYRTSPIWIGEKGDTLTTAPYVPPVYDDMQQAITDWERFVNYDESLPPLLGAALAHYQFEMIHPFIDGNGRMGRIVTLLYLQQRGAITYPFIPLSTILNRHEALYCGAIQRVHETQDYEAWCYFFLRAVNEVI